MARTALQQISSPLLLIPAYGKNCPSVEALRKAWESGADFKPYGMQGQYCSIRDLANLARDASSVTLVCPRTAASVKVA